MHSIAYFKKIRKNKYNAQRVEYGGHNYHSKGEARYAQNLDWRKKAKDIKDWKGQVKISLDVNGKHICNYFIDFKVIHNDDSIELIEYKGVETASWKLKWRLLEALIHEIEPGALLTIVK